MFLEFIGASMSDAPPGQYSGCTSIIIVHSGPAKPCRTSEQQAVNLDPMFTSLRHQASYVGIERQDDLVDPH